MPLPAFLLILLLAAPGRHEFAMTGIPGEFFSREACESALAAWRLEAKQLGADGYCLPAYEFHGAVNQLYGR